MTLTDREARKLADLLRKIRIKSEAKETRKHEVANLSSRAAYILLKSKKRSQEINLFNQQQSQK